MRLSADLANDIFSRGDGGNPMISACRAARTYSSLRRLLLVCLLLVCIAAAQTGPRRGGRYDRQILVEIQKIISSHREYKDVHAQVEDGIVNLTGTVYLESSRAWIEDRARRIAHVQDVRSSVVLAPPVEPDHELSQRIQARLLDAGFPGLRFTVHSGAVTLEGVVRNRKELRRVMQTVRSTAGVRETMSKITTAGDSD